MKKPAVVCSSRWEKDFLSERPRVLITRPAADAAPLAAELIRRGIDSFCEPLLDISILEGDILPPLKGLQGLLFTSANGVRAFARHSADRSLPAFAVGEATGREAEATGFTRVHVAGGNVERLAELVARTCDPAAGGFLHPAASKLAGDLSGSLSSLGFSVTHCVLYEAITAPRLSDQCQKGLNNEKFDAVLLFSPRTARTFAKLVRQAGMEQTLEPLCAICLSDAVAAEMKDLPWQDVHTAAHPDQASLLKCLDWLTR